MTPTSPSTVKPTEEALRALLRRRELALVAAERTRAVLPHVAAVDQLGDVLAAKAANRIELAAVGLERIASGCVRDLRLARRRFHLPADIAATIDALGEDDR